MRVWNGGSQRLRSHYGRAGRREENPSGYFWNSLGKFIEVYFNTAAHRLGRVAFYFTGRVPTFLLSRELKICTTPAVRQYGMRIVISPMLSSRRCCHLSTINPIEYPEVNFWALPILAEVFIHSSLMTLPSAQHDHFCINPDSHFFCAGTRGFSFLYPTF